MIVHTCHSLAHQNLPVGNQPLIYQLVKHRIQRAFLRDDPSAALPLCFLHKLIAIHILFFQQSQNHQRHHTPAKAHLSVICCHAIPLPLYYFVLYYNTVFLFPQYLCSKNIVDKIFIMCYYVVTIFRKA